jgi:NAD(P)H-dependent flavin oxidoreductase YrpB (nitropropane dioxygenase family)
LSQRISEGDGIAIIARVGDVDAARTAEEQGAKALAVERAVAGIRESTSLPLLWLGAGAPVDADAVAVRPGGDTGGELETVLHVRDEDELEAALEEHDPEIFLLAWHGDEDGDGDPLESVLELLPDVPAGKLAIAGVDVATRDEVLALERAGFDAVLAPAGQVGGLVGHAPPDV